MKTLIIGASGTIGSAIVKCIAGETDILTASPNSSDLKVDLSDTNSIAELFKQTGQLDAIVCAASRGTVFKTVMDMSIEDYQASLQQKCFGQIELVLKGVPVLNDGGSITLTTGAFGTDYIANGSAAAMANRAVEGFAQAAALELPRRIRLNVVSPALLEESVSAYGSLCPGFEPVSSQTVARAYQRSIFGIQTGQIFRPA